MRWLAAIGLATALGGCDLIFVLDEPGKLDAGTDVVDSPDPGGPRLVFTTSTLFNGNLGGLDGGDEQCQRLANSAQLPGTYKAWLSDSAQAPATRFNRGSSYTLVNGSPVATSFDDLIDGMPTGLIVLDESGSSAPIVASCAEADVWTSTDSAGNAGTANCLNWTNDGVAVGQVGTWTSGPKWTVNCIAQCSIALPLYCFQQ